MLFDRFLITYGATGTVDKMQRYEYPVLRRQGKNRLIGTKCLSLCAQENLPIHRLTNAMAEASNTKIRGHPNAERFRTAIHVSLRAAKFSRTKN